MKPHFRCHRQVARYSLASVLLGVLCVGFVACSHPSTGGVTKGSGAYIASQADLKPDGNPGKRANMVMSGMQIPVDLQTKSSGDNFEIDLWYAGTLFEQEIYKSTADMFSLVNAAGETYTPPIPLVRLPMNVGDSWKWDGQMITGPVGRHASASIRTRDDKVDMAGTPTDALMVEVDLAIDSGASQPAMRRLAFWFVKDKGLVKRQFGDSTSRLPAPDQPKG